MAGEESPVGGNGCVSFQKILLMGEVLPYSDVEWPIGLGWWGHPGPGGSDFVILGPFLADFQGFCYGSSTEMTHPKNLIFRTLSRCL